MNSSLQHSYISKLLFLKADTQYSKVTQRRSQERKTIIQIQNKIVFRYSVFLFLKTFYDSKNYCILTFSCLIQVLRVQFGQPGKGSGVHIPYTSRCTPALIQSPIW